LPRYRAHRPRWPRFVCQRGPEGVIATGMAHG
jgi:hypothetical protein